MYTAGMRDLIQRVEKTRPSRLGQEYKRMTPEERQEVLERFHPDYIKEGFFEIAIGPNRGYRAPRELVALLHSKSPLAEPFDTERCDYSTDVLIIGGGGAGTAAAIMAQEEGAGVLVATKLRFGDSNTVMAQGGIQAATLPHDSPLIHYLDAVGGGHFTNVPRLVYNLVREGPLVIKWLENFGVMFDKTEGGTLMPVHGGGTSRKRMHAARDYTGAEIMRILRDEAQNRGIEVLEFSPAVELLLDEEGRAAGAVLLNLETGEYNIVRAKTVILSCGGSGRLHYQGFPTTNHYGATADALVMAYRAGAKLKYMDTIQYHPTGVAFPPQILGVLVTEKLRSMGATPLNVDGELFVHHLETRDVEAAAIIRECREREKGVETPTGMKGVWLDTPLLEILHGEGTLEKNFPAMVRQFGRFDIDLRCDPLLIYPTLHYQNGGLEINEEAETDVENLFAAGENTGGVHGRNRLAGNSLLDVLVYGRRAGVSAAHKAAGIKEKPGKLSLEHVQAYHRFLDEAGITADGAAPLLLPRYTHREKV